MTKSLYDFTAASYLQTLDALRNVLNKGSAHCASSDKNENELLTARLA
ncbi:DUF1993 family protein [Congregibacter sp.]|jgi:hypothetical protein